MSRATKIGEDSQYEYFIKTIKGITARYIKNKSTGHVYVYTDDFVRVLGLADSLADLLSTDKGLDMVSECLKKDPRGLRGKETNKVLFQVV